MTESHAEAAPEPPPHGPPPHEPRVRRGVLAFFALCLLLAGGLYAVWVGWIPVPARWAPWKTVDLREPPGFFTRFQLAQLRASPEACFAALDAAGVQYARQADRPTQNGCGIVDAARLQTNRLPWSGPYTATCPTLAALHMWERHVVAPAAQRHFGAAVARIEHLGTYNCRNMRGDAGIAGFRSQHATANAIDVAAFVLDDGRRVTVLDGWPKAGAAEGRFLRELRDGACSLFAVTLGPDRNRAHANHFHLDMGRFRACD